jgi:hypothetical protein
MPNRLIIPLIVAATVAFARGSFAHDEKSIVEERKHAAENAAPIVTTFDVTRPKNDADNLKFSLHITNNTPKMLELRFPDGQTHDFIVVDFAGKEVWRWSEGRMFTSAMRSTTLKGKGVTTFEENWDATGMHGSFTAIATLRSDNFPVESKVQFVLP